MHTFNYQLVGMYKYANMVEDDIQSKHYNFIMSINQWTILCNIHTHSWKYSWNWTIL